MNSEDNYCPPKSVLQNNAPQIIASRWRRLGSALIDIAIPVMAWGALIFFSGFDANTLISNQPILAGYTELLLGFVIFIVLHGYLLATSGQTIGKRILGIRIVSAESNCIMPLKHLIISRYLPVSILSFIPMAGGLFVLLDP